MSLDKKKLKGYLKTLFILMLAFYVIRTFIFGITVFWFGVALSIINYTKTKAIFTFEPKYKKLKARTIIKGSSTELGNLILNSYRAANLNSFDFMLFNSKEMSNNAD